MVFHTNELPITQFIIKSSLILFTVRLLYAIRFSQIARLCQAINILGTDTCHPNPIISRIDEADMLDPPSEQF